MNRKLTARRLATTSAALAALAVITGPAVATAVPAQSVVLLTCQVSTTLDQAADQAPDPDGAVTGLVAGATKKVKYRITNTYTGCTGGNGVVSGSGSGSVTLDGTCLSALAPAAGTIKWTNGQGATVGNSSWSGSYQLLTTGSGGNAVTTLVGTGEIDSGLFAHSVGAVPRAAIDGTALSCVTAPTNPIGTVTSSGTIALVGI